MEENNKETVLHAMYLCMKPLAEIMLTTGIGQKEAIQAMKLAAVDVARSKYGIRSRRTNTSRIAVMTGLTRKDVSRLLVELDKGERGTNAQSAPSLRLLERWKSEPEFLDKHGRPADLPFKGEDGSFTSLVRKFGADVPAGAMRTELLRMGCILTLTNDVIRYVGENAVSNRLAETLAVQLEQVAAPMLANIAALDEFDMLKRGATASRRVRGVVRVEDVERVEKACVKHFDALIEGVESMMRSYEMLHGDELTQADPSDLREVNVGAHLYAQIPPKKGVS
jgi:hypothetical protein